MSEVIRLDDHRPQASAPETFAEPVYEPLPRRAYDLQLLAELVNTLGVPVDEAALEAAFHTAVQQSRTRNVRVEDALEIAAYAVLNYERTRRDIAHYQEGPF